MEAEAKAANPSRRLPGVEGVWIFVAADMVIFGLLFVSFIFARQDNPSVFLQSSRTLNFNFGGVNTLLLLTSSWCVARAVEASKVDDRKSVSRGLALALVLGLCFCASKVVEYTREITSGVSMLTNDFYMYYFTLTGIHLLHVVAGCVALFLLLKRSKRQFYAETNRVSLETGATYWHMVDLLWIVIFPLLYLLK